MGEVNYIRIKQKDNYVTILSHYICDKPVASVLILHGMAEHQGRYTAFAKYLVSMGYDVFIYNHRGHGTDKKIKELGYIAPNKGYKLLVEDAINISNYINQHNRSDKLFLIGHSMGSLISRNIIQRYNKYNGVILIGTSNPLNFVTKIGLILSFVIKKYRGPKYLSPFLNRLIFGGKNYTSLANRTQFDWLTRRHGVVGAYINDPYCGFICSISFYSDLLMLVSNASKKSLNKQIQKSMPIFIISGEKDPVGGYGIDIKRLYNSYKQLGLTNVSLKLYPDCRHELLNELNYDEVYSDINSWILEQK